MSWKHDFGDSIRSTWTLAFSTTGAPADPPFVLFLIKKPDGTELVSIYGLSGQPYPITQQSSGVYYADVPLDQASVWTRRWVAFDENETVVKARETKFTVKPSAFTTPIPDPTP